MSDTHSNVKGFRGFSAYKELSANAPSVKTPKTDSAVPNNNSVHEADTDSSVNPDQLNLSLEQPVLVRRRSGFKAVANNVSAPKIATAEIPDDGTPDPNFGNPETVTTITVRVGDIFFSDEKRAMAWATAENGNQKVKIKIAGPIEIKDNVGKWLQITGKFKKDIYKGRPSLLINVYKMQPGWPRYEASTRQALRDVFKHEIEDCTKDHAARAEYMKKIEDLASGEPGLMQRMIDQAEKIISGVDIPNHIQLSLLIRWLDITGPERIKKALKTAGISDAIADRIMERWREKVHKALEGNPYLIIGFGARFEEAEALADRLNVNSNVEVKLLGYIHDTLRRAQEEGSTVISVAEMIERAIMKHFEIDPQRIENITELTEEDFGPDMPVGIVETVEQKYFGLLSNIAHEMAIAEWISKRLNEFREFKKRNPERYKQQFSRARELAVAALQELLPGKPVDMYQAEAVATAALEPVCIITGGPGTGKTTVSKAMISVLEKMGHNDIILGAPTGKAAQRLTDLAERQANTLHSVLRAIPNGDTVTFTDVHFEPGATLMIDEASMVDVALGHGAIDAMPDDGKLVLVGDDGQIEPVGPGQMLADLIRSCAGGINRVPIIKLVKLYRQDDSGGIAKAAAMILNGQCPEINHVNYVNEIVSGNWGMIETPDNEITQTIIDQVKDMLDRGMTPSDFVVLSPMRKGPGGTHEVNAALSKLFNPNGKPYSNRSYDNISGPPPRIGDRIMVTINYKHETLDDMRVVNGDVGYIHSVVGTDMMLKLDGREELFPLPKKHWHNIILGYGVTIHKSQGSQYNTVIMPMTMVHSRMLERRLIRTGWTRATDHLLLVGDPNALQFSVDVDRSNVRRTILASLLEAVLEQDPTMKPLLTLTPEPVSNPGVDYNPEHDFVNPFEEIEEEQEVRQVIRGGRFGRRSQTAPSVDNPEP